MAHSYQHRRRAPRAPAFAPDESVEVSPRLLMKLGRATEMTIMQMIDTHERNYHDRGPLAFDGYALLHQLSQDAQLRHEFAALFAVA